MVKQAINAILMGLRKGKTQLYVLAVMTCFAN
jgi:hypothetical protein